MKSAVRVLPKPVYDYTECENKESLKCVIQEINRRGYLLVSVTQESGQYMVFFRRSQGLEVRHYE